MDVAVAAVNSLEGNPVFNAGTGSCTNKEGVVEMDALVVDGTSFDFGAVAAIQRVAHPISVARAVLEKTDHCMLAGEGATRFAHAQGFEDTPSSVLAATVDSGPQGDTVGAVVLDDDGQIVAATSTGGTRDKMPGRVGDSPIIGCGAIAEDGVGGVSATGWGESLMKAMTSRAALEYMRGGASAHEASQRAIADLERRVNGNGGVICVDAQCNVAFAHNTPHIAVAYCQGDGEITSILSQRP